MSEAERRAPVNGSPGGTIAWSEHVEAWEAYHRQYRDQDAERIAARGGFGLVELLWQLGHMPVTWEPGPDALRHFEQSGVTFAPVSLASRDARLAVWHEWAAEWLSDYPDGETQRVRELRAALHSDPSEATCSGAGDCPASLHVHGCFADRDGAVCDDPSDHDLAPTSRPDVESPSEATT